MAYEKKTIAEVIEEIDNNRIFLPAIQRKYVWTEEQIAKLMDSILHGYPFGTFLFWKVKKRTVNERQYSMYQFIKNYHQRDHYKNEPAGLPFNVSETNPDETILSALDGQQRLTSLLIALKGSISMKLPKKHKNNDDAYPKKELYFDLHSDKETAYEFAFLTNEEATDESKLWYRVKDILQYANIPEVMIMLTKNNLHADQIAVENTTALFSSIKIYELINYFEVTSDSIDDVLDIFVRVNSGGTVLSKTDLLFSTIVSYWDKGREEIDNLLSTINRVGEHYSFTNDFIMRTCLYVMDMPIALKVDAFGEDNVNKIKSAWNRIKLAIKDTVTLLNELGFNAENIVADNAILPIIYYRYKYGDEAFKNDDTLDVRLELRKYLVISQIKHIFGQSTNTTLSTIRTELEKHTDKFKLAYLQNLSFADKRTLLFSEDDIEGWFDDYEKNAYTFMLLSLLYPNLKYGQKVFHQDHMHPASSFDKKKIQSITLPNGEKISEEKIKLWKSQRNTLANLQMLEGRENEIKNDTPLIEWLKEPDNKENVKYLPVGIDYSLSNFDQFIEERKKLMLNELKRILLPDS